MTALGDDIVYVSSGTGADRITVAAADAIIRSGSGADHITIAGPGGDYILVLGDGPDRVVFQAAPDRLSINDLRTADSGDVLDFTALLKAAGWPDAKGNPFETGYARLVEIDFATVVEILGSDGTEWIQVASLFTIKVADLYPYNLGGFASPGNTGGSAPTDDLNAYNLGGIAPPSDFPLL